MKLNLHIRLVSVLAASCLLLSMEEVVQWASGMPSRAPNAFIGGCIAILYPYADSYRRRFLGTGAEDLISFLFGALCMGLPLLAVTVIHQTLPMLVMTSVFFTAAVYHYPARRAVDRYLMGAAFLLVWGLVGRATLGRAWMVLAPGHTRLLLFMIPAAILTTIVTGGKTAP